MFTIDPPLHVRGREAAMISSIEQAAAFLRTHPARFDDDEMLVQLENVSTTEDAKIAGEAFRAWVQDQGILLVPAYPEPDGENAAGSPQTIYDPPLPPCR